MFPGTIGLFEAGVRGEEESCGGRGLDGGELNRYPGTNQTMAGFLCEKEKRVGSRGRRSISTGSGIGGVEIELVELAVARREDGNFRPNLVPGSDVYTRQAQQVQGQHKVPGTYSTM